MASIVSYAGGLRRIEFSLTPRGERQYVRLGRVTMKVAETWKAKIEAIISDKLAGRPHDAELARWLGHLDEKMVARLTAAGLADGLGLANVGLGVFLQKFKDTLAGKDSTQKSYGNVVRNLQEYFGPARSVRSISAVEADAWRAWLVSDQKLAVPTIGRRVIAARTIWRKAIRWKFASENPFTEVTAGIQENEARKMFIRAELISRVITNAPDNEWKLIIALARYGGFRCPSEHYALRWSHVDWERDRITIYASKTEHHQGGASRVIPIFAELRPYLLKAFEDSELGTEFVIAKHRLGGLNLRQQFERIIMRAGETPWPRLFQNLRASRETELMREYDLATVCKWIGNSPAVAAKHYAMSVDLSDDFRRAVGPKAQQNAQESAAVAAGQQETQILSENEKTPENGGYVDPSQPPANVGSDGKWALQGSNL